MVLKHLFSFLANYTWYSHKSFDIFCSQRSHGTPGGPYRNPRVPWNPVEKQCFLVSRKFCKFVGCLNFAIFFFKYPPSSRITPCVRTAGTVHDNNNNNNLFISFKFTLLWMWKHELEDLEGVGYVMYFSFISYPTPIFNAWLSHGFGPSDSA